MIGLLMGGILGFTRIVQGGHFLSDVIYAAWTIYLTNLSLAYFFQLNTHDHEENIWNIYY